MARQHYDGSPNNGAAALREVVKMRLAEDTPIEIQRMWLRCVIQSLHQMKKPHLTAKRLSLTFTP